MAVEERVVRRVMKEEGSVSPGLVHFVGIGGAGLSALAFLALEQVATEFTGSSSRVLISSCCNF
jgi:UDP-N-acetylmuramate-alanine ligase